jgi:hypothetical protein
MASRSDIRAGGAFVELSLKNSDFLKGLRRSGDQLRDFGKGIAIMGASITAAGAAILGPIVYGLKKFTDSGEALYEMSKRTGVSAEALAQLGYAAKQSGTDLEGVEGAIRKMQKFMGAAETGTKEARTELHRLGLSVADLKSLAPEQQFETIGAKIAGIVDPTARAAAAMKIFGKTGTTILPLLDNLDKVAEARRLGIGPSQQEVKLAHELFIGFSSLSGVADSLARSLGAALAPAVLGAIDPIRKIVVHVKSWLKAHSDLIQKIAAGGAVLVGVGTIITALGGAIAIVGWGLSKLATPLVLVTKLFGGLTALAGALLTPFGLIAAALGAGVFLWAKYTAAGQQAVAGFSAIGATFGKTFNGIRDAIAGGDLSLAGSIAMTGLRVAMLQGTKALASAVGGALGDFMGTVASQIAGGDFAGAWSTVVAGMGELWAQFSKGVVTVFVAAANAVIDVWQKAASAIGEFMRKQIETGTALGKLLSIGSGFDAAQFQKEQRNVTRLTVDEAANRGLLSPEAMEAHGKAARMKEAASTDPERREFLLTQADALERSVLAEAERRLAEAGHGIGQASSIKASDFIKGQADAMRAALAEVQRQADWNAKKADEKFHAKVGGGMAANDDALNRAQAQLNELHNQALVAAQAAAAKLNDQKAALPGAGAIGGAHQEVLATFSAAVAQRWGDGFANPQIDKLEQIRKLNEAQNRHLAELNQAMGKNGFVFE